MTKGYTFVKEHKIVYEWKIKEISSHLKKIKDACTILESSEFSTGAKINDKWRIELFLNNGFSPEYSEKYISMFLINLTNNIITVKLTFSMLDNKQKIVALYNLESKFEKNDNWGTESGIEKEKLLNNKSTLIPNDILTVYAEIVFLDDAITIPIKSSFNFSKSQMADDYKELYNSKVNSDVTIVTGDKEFQAHKIIMMARSPVLSAMFTHEMIEKKSKQVSIPDISPEIFEKVLEYIYTDEVTDLVVVAADLLEAANKYQILSLKRMCEHSLCTTLNCQNAVKRLILADRHDAGQLSDYVTECIAADASNIIATDDFKELEKSSPISLGLKLFKKLASDFNIIKPKITYSS